MIKQLLTFFLIIGVSFSIDCSFPCKTCTSSGECETMSTLFYIVIIVSVVVFIVVASIVGIHCYRRNKQRKAEIKEKLLEIQESDRQARQLQIKQKEEQQKLLDAKLEEIIITAYNEENNFLNLCKKLAHLENVVQEWPPILKKRNWKTLAGLSLCTSKNYLENCFLADFKMQGFGELQWPKLQYLNFKDNFLSTYAISQLINVKFDSLVQLDLQNNSLYSKGTILLTKIHMPNLESLNIMDNFITREGARHLTKANWPKLKSLIISENVMGIDGALGLANNSWKQLKIFFTKDDYYSKQDCHALMMLPLVTIEAKQVNISIFNDGVLSGEDKIKVFNIFIAKFNLNVMNENENENGNVDQPQN